MQVPFDDDFDGYKNVNNVRLFARASRCSANTKLEVRMDMAIEITSCGKWRPVAVKLSTNVSEQTAASTVRLDLPSTSQV
jgi:hypothetical protein